MPFGSISHTSVNQTAKANNLFDAVAPLSVYGYDAETTIGLYFGYFGGLVTVIGGSKVAVPASTVLLTASATNYVVMNLTTGAVSASTATTNWNNSAGYARLYSVVAAAATITSVSDYRQPSEYLGSVAYNDARLTDAREWSASTVTQAEAEAGTATTRRAWTAQRIKQAFSAFFAALTNIDGKEIGASTPAKATVTTLVADLIINAQPDPAVVNSTATLTAAALLTKLVVSTPTANITLTLPSGADIDAAMTIGVNQSFDWTLLCNASFTITVADGSSGHTRLGSTSVGAFVTALFRTRKVSSGTFVTFRIG